MTTFYDKIESSIRPIVKALRDNGINTLCSCGHGMWIQCETYDATEELITVNTIITSLGITEYIVKISEYVKDENRRKFLEISFPDNGGNYYWRTVDNPDYTNNIDFVKGE